DDQCEGSKDEGCGQEGIEWGAILVRGRGSCATKTKDRGEGQGHKQREYEAAIDEKLFEGSAQNEQGSPETLENDGAGQRCGAGVESGKPGTDHAVARHGPIHARSCPCHGAHRSGDGETEY